MLNIGCVGDYTLEFYFYLDWLIFRTQSIVYLWVIFYGGGLVFISLVYLFYVNANIVPNLP